MSMANQAVVFAETSGDYWLAGLLTLAVALVVMVVMLSESKEDRTP